MGKKEILEKILNLSGFTMEKFELIRNNGMVGYEFEARKNNEFQFSVASDDFDGALSETLEGIYTTDNVSFNCA